MYYKLKETLEGYCQIIDIAKQIQVTLGQQFSLKIIVNGSMAKVIQTMAQWLSNLHSPK